MNFSSTTHTEAVFKEPQSETHFLNDVKNSMSNERDICVSVDTIARIAVYDDLLSSPKIIDIQPNTTREYINDIAATVHSAAKEAGGSIPYSIILQVAENFIHSYFSEVVVTVLDNGNTIRFSDQGPGIIDKQKATMPGFSSATAEMKRVIHGVGSGLPIVSEYMQTTGGRIEIDDNMDNGAVITISLSPSSHPSLGSPITGEVAATGASRSSAYAPNTDASPYSTAPANTAASPSFAAPANTAASPSFAAPANVEASTFSALSTPAATTEASTPFSSPASPSSAFNPSPSPKKSFYEATAPETTRLQGSQNIEVSPAQAHIQPISTERLIRSTLSERGLEILQLFLIEDAWRVTDISNQLNLAASTVHNELKKLQEAGMITTLGKKRVTTELGARFLNGEL